jgi:transposase-like protein
MSTALTERSGTGLTNSRRPRATRRRRSRRRVAADEKHIEVDGEEKWLYAAIDVESKLLLEVDVNSHRETDPAAAFLESLAELHDLHDTEFLVDGMGYLSALARHRLSGQLDYNDRNHIESRPVSTICMCLPPANRKTAQVFANSQIRLFTGAISAVPTLSVDSRNHCWTVPLINTLLPPISAVSGT